MKLNRFIFERIFSLLQMLHLQFLVFNRYFIDFFDPTVFLIDIANLIFLFALFHFFIVQLYFIKDFHYINYLLLIYIILLFHYYCSVFLNYLNCFHVSFLIITSFFKKFYLCFIIIR